MNLYVLIATIDNALCDVPDELLPAQEGVRYVICWQQSGTQAVTTDALQRAEAALRAREDVTLTTLQGRGLCRNRNHAIETALSLLSSPLEDAAFVIADDDERFLPDAFDRIRTAYERHPKMDAALFRLRSLNDRTYFKAYPPRAVVYGHHPRSYYVCSWEMTFRTRVWQMGMRFDERFGLGADVLCAGEEEVLLHDLLSKRLHILVLPEDIGYTDAITTGTRVTDEKVLMSKGAVYARTLSPRKARLRALREACSLALKLHTNPFTLFQTINKGLQLICAPN